MSDMKKCSYVTLVMRGDHYIPGAIVLAHSLRLTNTIHDINCMVTSDVSANAIERLKILFDNVIPVDYIRIATKSMKNNKLEAKYGSWMSVGYTKWNILSLVQYRKVMFVDSDIVVIRNIDHLFNEDIKTPAATFSLSQASPFVKKGLYNPYSNIKHGGVVKCSLIKQGLSRSFVCIGTTLILTPDINALEEYKTLINSLAPFGYKNCINGSDEQSIVVYYNSKNINWTQISQSYNMIPWKESIWLPSDEKTNVIHYVSDIKPWKLNREEWPDLILWWNLADDIYKIYPSLVGFTNV